MNIKINNFYLTKFYFNIKIFLFHEFLDFVMNKSYYTTFFNRLLSLE